MKQKIVLTILALIGFIFLFSGSAWANRDHRHGHGYDKHRSHYGHYDNKRQGRGHGPQHGPKRFQRGPHHRGWYVLPVHRTAAKHVYHYYPGGGRYFCSGHYHAAGTVVEPGLVFSFGISR